MLKKFKQLVKLQEDIKEQITNKLKTQLKLIDYKDKIEVKSINCVKEFQSDCDGDDNHIWCRINLELKSEEAKKNILILFDEERYQCYDIKLKSINDPLFGNRYDFEYKFYIKD
jgi:acyl-CoA thioesterase